MLAYANTGVSLQYLEIAQSEGEDQDAPPGAPLSSPKTASLVGSIGQGWPIESGGARTATPDDPLAAKMAEGTRSASAGGVVSFGYFSLDKQR